MREEATGKTGVPSPTRQKPERPRDRLGRPLAWDAENQLHLPNFDAMTLDQNHQAGRRLAGEGNWFGAHEAWETAWKQARDTRDAELFKGLSQLGAGYVHLLRGNAHGAVTLLRRASSRVGSYPADRLGVDCPTVAAWAEADAERVERGELTPGEDAPVRAPRI